MRILIVGIGALGGTIAARAISRGMPVSLATRSVQTADRLRGGGLYLSGIGGEARADAPDVAPIEDYRTKKVFDLIVLATKARDALEIAPNLIPLLTPEGVLLPIQNGGVSQMLADRIGEGQLLGGFSNLGATMIDAGVFEQRNAGHLLIGELGGGSSERAARVAEQLGRAVEVRVSTNLKGAIWSKLLLNCSVTTLGAIAGSTMRGYIASVAGRKLFDRVYDEALNVALASGAQPERMVVEPIPPAWHGKSTPGAAHEQWLEQVLKGYGDVKPSMLQDIERGRATEIDFINGYIVDAARETNLHAPLNAEIVETIHAIERGQIRPAPILLQQILEKVS